MFKADRLLKHSTLGSINEEKKNHAAEGAPPQVNPLQHERLTLKSPLSPKM